MTIDHVDWSRYSVTNTPLSSFTLFDSAWRMVNKMINCKSSKKYKIKRKFTFFSKYKIHFISWRCALMKILMFSTHSLKYIWYSPQKSKYPLKILLLFTFSSSSEVDHLANGSLYSFRYGQCLHIHSVLGPGLQFRDEGMNYCCILVRVWLYFFSPPPGARESNQLQQNGSYREDWYCLFVLMLYVPVVMSGRVFLGWTSTKQQIKGFAQGHNFRN